MAPPAAAPSQHGCAIVLSAHGVVVVGPSGSGKSRLCQSLIELWNRNQKFARWVADDRVIFNLVSNQIEARSPEPIQGMVERRFAGIEKVTFQRRAIVDLVVELVAPHELDRLPDSPVHAPLPDGPKLPLIRVPFSNHNLAIELIAAKIT